MHNEFDINGFISYMEDKYPESGSPILFELICNVVEFANEHKNFALDQMVNFLVDLIPESEFGEIAQFAPDDSLSKAGLEEKNKWNHRDEHIMENMSRANKNVLNAVDSALCLFDPEIIRVVVDSYGMISIEVVEQGEYMNRVEFVSDCDILSLGKQLNKRHVEFTFAT